MEMLARNGGQFRTKLMTAEAAARFARCLQANAKFTGIAICPSDRAKGEKNQYVTFVSATDPAGEKILARQQQTRSERASEQGAGYEFVLDSSGNHFWALNLMSGEVYETTEQSCSCPDHEFRCRPAGIVCKHVEMLTKGHSIVRGWGETAAAPVQVSEERARAARALWE